MTKNSYQFFGEAGGKDRQIGGRRIVRVGFGLGDGMKEYTNRNNTERDDERQGDENGGEFKRNELKECIYISKLSYIKSDKTKKT